MHTEARIFARPYFPLPLPLRTRMYQSRRLCGVGPNFNAASFSSLVETYLWYAYFAATFYPSTSLCMLYVFLFFFFRIFAIRVNSQPLQIDISVGWICIFFNTFPFLLEGMSTILDREFLNIFASFFFLMFIVWSMEYIDYRVRVQINIKKMRFLQSKKYVINVSNVMIN